MSLWAMLTGCKPDPAVYRHLEAEDAARLDTVLESAGLTREDLSGDTPKVVAHSLDGRLRDLFLQSAPKLSTLGWVSELDGLEELRVVGAELPRLDGLSPPCSLRRLRLGRNGLEDLSALEACEQLEALWIVEEPLESLVTLPALPNLRELYIDEVALEDLAGMPGRDSLETLLVRNAGLKSLRGVGRLPRLRTLDVQRNELESFAGLGDLPALEKVHAARNRLTDASGLDRLPSLVEVDLRLNRLETFPAVALRGDAPKITDNPGAEAYFVAQARAEADARRRAREAEQPDGHLTELPERRGSVRGTRGSLSWSGRSVSGDGSIARLEGMWFVELHELDPANVIDPHKNAESVRATVSVESGRLRVIFAEQSTGYAYKDVSPGEPASVRARLVESSFAIGFFVHAVDGVSEGLRYELEPDR